MCKNKNKNIPVAYVIVGSYVMQPVSWLKLDWSNYNQVLMTAQYLHRPKTAALPHGEGGSGIINIMQLCSTQTDLQQVQMSV